MNHMFRIFENKIKLEKTKSGLPATWEAGGGKTNTGDAIIIAGADGSPKKPIYIRKRGQLANDDHALFVVREGDLVITAEHHREDFEITVYRIAQITERKCRRFITAFAGTEEDRAKDDADSLGLKFVSIVEIKEKYLWPGMSEVWYEASQPIAELALIHSFSGNEWDVKPDNGILDAVEAAVAKAKEYHCRRPFWFLPA